MTAKEYLQQLTNLHLRIAAIEGVIAEYYEKAQGTAAGSSELPPSVMVTDNRTEDRLIKLAESSEKLQELCDELEVFAYKVTIEINRLKNSTYAALLINKYVRNRTWEQVAEDIGLNTDYTKGELHGKALAAFEREVMNTSQNLLAFPC